MIKRRIKKVEITKATINNVSEFFGVPVCDEEEIDDEGVGVICTGEGVDGNGEGDTNGDSDGDGDGDGHEEDEGDGHEEDEGVENMQLLSSSLYILPAAHAVQALRSGLTMLPFAQSLHVTAPS